MTARSVAIVCALLLLFAQQAAFTHAVWHAHEEVPAQHDGHDDDSFHSGLCGLHGALSQVLGGVQGPDSPRLVAPRLAEAIPDRSDDQVVLELHVPLSRGPPTLS